MDPLPPPRKACQAKIRVAIENLLRLNTRGGPGASVEAV